MISEYSKNGIFLKIHVFAFHASPQNGIFWNIFTVVIIFKVIF